MSPRPGGESDKIGNRYEAAWAVRHALYCIINDGEYSLTLEDIDLDLAKGSEFTYQDGAITEVHQLKRQNGNSNSWSVKSLAALGVFESAAGHVAVGRAFHFVSLVPCRPLQELAERARKSKELSGFIQDWLTEELRNVFDQLSASAVLGSPQRAWRTLRGMWFLVQDENDMMRMNSMLARCQFEGAAGAMVSLAIGDILLDHLGKKLTRSDLLELLALQGIRPIEAASRKTMRDQVRSITDRWYASVRRELLQPRIERTEATQLIESLQDHRTGIVAGAAGGGKSSVLEQAVELLEATGAHVLAFRLDRFDSFTSTVELGQLLGLDTSPATALALSAEGRDAYLVIDQLDAVSLASGRIPESFDVVADLVGEALSVTGMKVILACREFDIENDHRIRSLADRTDAGKTTVNLLSAEMVDAAVTAMGLEAGSLSASQRATLQTPMHLVLLKTIAGQAGAVTFQSRGSLFEAYWERKRQNSRARRSGVRFNDVISRIANEASDRQTLSIPIEVLDDSDLIEDANVLVSEHVLARDGARIAFFHEAFFDYAFARQWVSRSETLVAFLLRDEQELFRRAQVRQILQHLYEREPDRFRAEVEAVLTSDRVRFHIKETVLAVLSTLSSPSSEDVEAVLRVAATAPQLEAHLWSHTRRSAWFRRFFEDGYIDDWLDSEESELQTRALNLMMTSVRDESPLVAELLHARQSHPQYLEWVRWTVGRADAHRSRTMFDLLLGAVRAGGFDETRGELWLAVHDLAKYRPLWAIELIRARIIEHPEGLEVDEQGVVSLLKFHDYSATELVREASAAEPLAFAEKVVPYLLRVMAATAYEPHLGYPIADKHFSFRFHPDELDDRDLDDALFAGSVSALEKLAQTKPDKVRPLLETISADPHDGAQFMLYRALTAGVKNFQGLISSLLLEGGARLSCGYPSDSVWVARELLRSVSPLVDDEVHQKLENLFRDLRIPYETTYSFGRTAFKFLSAMEEERLSPAGARRLNEHRRKFHETTPSEPDAGRGGWIGSPISAEAASKMSDDQWLGAMARYETDETNWVRFTGGDRQLSQVLKAQAAEDPIRFARLALRLTPSLSPAYADGLLMGFAEAAHTEQAAPLIFDAVRHLAALGHEEVDRWLGSALQHYYREVPLDLVDLILHRTLSSTDPSDDSPIFTRKDDNGRSAVDMHTNAINTARGSLVEALGDLLIFDTDGKRTELVRPYLVELANDPVIFVRASVAHTLAAALRHARPQVEIAFQTLIENNDRVLATHFVRRLMIYLGNVDPTLIDPVIDRMLGSQDPEARQEGGRLAAFAALEWGRAKLIDRVFTSDKLVRTGAAEVCANHVDSTSNAKLASSVLMALMDDAEPEVQEAVAKVAMHLRDKPLRPFMALLKALIESPVCERATPQLWITLQNSTDKVDELVLQASRRYISIFGADASDIRTGAAGDARYISQLVVRGLAQSRNKAHRAELLDVLDGMLLIGAYGVDDAVTEAERF